MSNKTKIEWTDATINFWRGCTKVSPGCKYCYMYRDQTRYGRDPTQVVQVKESSILSVLKKSKSKRIFVNSWSDFFIPEADAWRNKAWETLKNN